MKNQLKNSLKLNLTLLILSLICIVLGAASCVFGELMIPFIVGVLSSIYLFDTKSKHSVSIIVSLLLLGLNVTAFILNLAVSMFAPTAIILSLIIVSAFMKGQSKSDSAYVMTVIAALFSLVGYILFAMIQMESYTVDAAIEYYRGLSEYLRNIFTDTMLEIYTVSGIEVTEEAVSAVFNQQINMIISYLLIGGFIISGIGMKLFGWIVSFCSEDKSHIKNWRFTTTRIYAYFYVLLVILSLFAISADSIFSISVLNLYNIFMVIFAYVGFTAAQDMLKKRMKPFTATVVLIGALLLFASFAAQILAALGVLFAVRTDKLNSNSTDFK